MQHFLCPIIFVLPYSKRGILFTGESHTVVENRSMDSHPPKPITTTLPGHVSNICMTQHRFTRFRTPLRHGQSFHSIIKTSNLKCKANTTSQQQENGRAATVNGRNNGNRRPSIRNAK